MKDNLTWMREVPIAHRGLHDIKLGRVENSLSAVRAAIKMNYSIEVDLQLTKDKKLVVFHDFILDRLTSESGSVRDYTMAELRKIKLENTQDHIPSLDELLDLVAGKIGIVLELKGIQDMDAGYVDALILTIAEYIEKHSGTIAVPIAVMSFDHWLLTDARLLACPCSLGLTAQGDDSFYQVHQKLTDELNVDFISYGMNDLPCKFVTEFKDTGKPVICWTVRNVTAWKQALIYTDQITFEGFDPNQQIEEN